MEWKVRIRLRQSLSLLISWSLILTSTPLGAIGPGETAEEELDSLRRRLGTISLKENKVKILQHDLVDKIQEIEDKDLQKRLVEIIASLASPEDLLIYSQREGLIASVGGYRLGEVKEEEILSHEAFKPLNDRIKSLQEVIEDEGLKKISAGGKAKNLVSFLCVIKHTYETYKRDLLNLPFKEIPAYLRPKAEFLGTLLKPSHLSRDLAYKIISHTPLDHVVKENESGKHPVASFGGVHFKVNEEHGALRPGMELAMYYLHKLLVGEGVTPSTLLCVGGVPIYDASLLDDTRKKIDQAYREGKSYEDLLIKNPQLDHIVSSQQDKKSYILQASYTIEGIGFDRFLQHVSLANWLREGKTAESYLSCDPQHPHYDFTKRFFVDAKGGPLKREVDPTTWQTFIAPFKPEGWKLEDIDFETFSKLTLMGLLTDPDDAKADNFMVYKKPASQKWTLISIDSDKALGDSITQNTKGSKKGSHYINHKNILYCLPELMNKSIAEAKSFNFKNHFEKLSAPLVLLKWLFKLKEENEAYAKLREESGEPIPVFEAMRLPIKFAPGKAISLLHRLEDLRNIFTTYDSHLTLNRLFQILHPIVFSYYQKALEKAPETPLEAIYSEHEWTIEKLLEESLDKPIEEQGHLTLKEALQTETHSAEEAEKSQTQSLEETIKELIQEIDTRSLRDKQKELEGNDKQKGPGGRSRQTFRGHSLNTHELILEAGDTHLFKQVMSLRGPQAVNPSIGRNFFKKHLKSSEKNQTDPLLSQEWEKLVNFNPKLHWYMSLDHVLLSQEDLKRVQEQKVKEGQGKAEQDKKDQNKDKQGKQEKAEQKQEQTIYKITGASEGGRYLPEEVWNQLFDRKGKFIRQNADGAHEVGKASKGGYTLYFKRFPKLPGTEEAVGRLTRQLIGFGAPHVELFRLGDESLLVSQEIKGLTLKETLKNHPERLKALEPESLGNLLLVAMIVNPEDGKPDNYIMEAIEEEKGKGKLSSSASSVLEPISLAPLNTSAPQPLQPLSLAPSSSELMSLNPSLASAASASSPSASRGKPLAAPQKPVPYRLVGIDNDQAFVPAIAKEQKPEGGRAHHVVQVKSILYCLDQMKEPISNTVRERFKALDPKKELTQWLIEIDRVHRQQEGLFENEKNQNILLQKLFKENDSYIGIAFKKGDLHQIYDRLLRLQEALHDSNVMTYQDLLMRVEPRLGRRYGLLLSSPQCPTDIYERFKKIDGEFYSQAMGTITSSKQVFGAQGISEKEALEDIIRKDRHYTPKIALKELEKRSEEAARAEALASLEELEGSQEDLASETLRKKIFEALDFNHARRKDNTYGPIPLNAQQKILKMIFPFEHHSLTLINCQALTDEIITKELKIRDITKLDLRGSLISKAETIQYLSEFCPGLTFLNLGGAKNLTIIEKWKLVGHDPLVFPALKVLNLASSGIEQLYLEAPKLERLEAKDCPKLREIQIKAPLLHTLDLSGGINLKEQTILSLAKGLPNLKEIKIEGCTQLPYQSINLPFLPFGELSLEGFKAYYLKATKENDAEAQNIIGDMYYYGQGVKQDYQEAMKWYLKAAEQNHAEAQKSIGLMYRYGKGVKQDYREAMKWYGKAKMQEEEYKKTFSYLTLYYDNIKDFLLEELNDLMSKAGHIKFDNDHLKFYAQFIYPFLPEKFIHFKLTVKSFINIISSQGCRLEYRSEFGPVCYLDGRTITDCMVLWRGDIIDVNNKEKLVFIDNNYNLSKLTSLICSLALYRLIATNESLDIRTFTCYGVHRLFISPLRLLFDSQSAKALGEIFLKYFKNLKSIDFGSDDISITDEGIAAFRQFIPSMSSLEEFYIPGKDNKKRIDLMRKNSGGPFNTHP